eukprot:1792622-Rhodomonas_salina.1
MKPGRQRQCLVSILMCAVGLGVSAILAVLLWAAQRRLGAGRDLSLFSSSRLTETIGKSLGRESDQSKLPSCARMCNGRPNVIRLRGMAAAGLWDRQYFVGVTSCIAAPLCARVLVGRPCDALSQAHNHKRKIDCLPEWNDLWNMTFDDGISTTVDLLHDPAGISKEALRSFDVTLTDINNNPSCKGNYNKDKKDRIRAQIGCLSTQLLAARDAVQENRTFLWHLPRHMFTDWMDGVTATVNEKANEETSEKAVKCAVRDKFQAKFGKCGVKLQPPDLISRVAESVLLREGITQPFAVLHLRRGDAIKHCDTSASVVASYATCSLQHCAARLPVLVFTEERNEKYLRDIEHVLSQVPQISRVVLADRAIVQFLAQPYEKLVKSLPVKNDSDSRPWEGLGNFYTFAVGNVMKDSSSVYMVRRRQEHCVGCDVWACDHVNAKVWAGHFNGTNASSANDSAIQLDGGNVQSSRLKIQLSGRNRLLLSNASGGLGAADQR